MSFYKAYKKLTPNFLQALIRPFWRLVLKIKSVFDCTLCLKMGSGWKRTDFVYKTLDYVRNSSLELAAREIYENKVPGGVAELGVYKGDFARYINQVFPDRKLYLFDTFEGFSSADEHLLERENKNYISRTGIFKDTNVEIVLRKMKHRENCVIKKGFFPETAEDVNERFAFVNIDADLSEPIYNGLCWFYPRLEKGGYIFVHDYNSKDWKGVKTGGVRKFAYEYGIPYFPLSDRCGSAVFMK